jgi:Meckel syndrome type 1 protein
VPQDPRTPGSLLFSYVQSDEYCDEVELGRSVTTSLYEDENRLVRRRGGGAGRVAVLQARHS